MRKHSLVLVLFVTYPAFSQVSSGTMVAIDFTKDQLVVAADSRATLNEDPSHPDDSECKIAALGNQLIFATVGSTRYTPSGAGDWLGAWDNIQEARAANQTATQIPPGEKHIQAVADSWVNAVTEHWRLFYRARPDRVGKFAHASGGVTTGLFAEASRGTIYFVAAQVALDRTAPFVPIIVPQFGQLSNCWESCHGDRVCGAGSHVDIAAQFCSETKFRHHTHVRTALKSSNRHTKLAVKVVELTIDAYEKSSGDVGGKVDAVTLNSNGTITWNARKKDCPENQD